jgi:hypothetical protein
MCAHGKVPGWPMCHCAACHRDFTGPSVFAEHQSVGPAGLVCHAPGEGRLVLVQTAEGGRELWGRPGQRAEGFADRPGAARR